MGWNIDLFKKYSNKKRLFLYFFVGLVLLTQFVFILFYHRDLIISKYDVSYWKDRFEHSQWVLPLSSRPIGDEGLFSYLGYELVHGMNPVSVNVETPPLGKYLLGLSIIIFGNPTFYSMLVTVSAFILLYILIYQVLRDRLASILLTTVTFLDPLLFSQAWLHLLDMLQLVFLLSNFILLNLYIKKKNSLTAILFGLSLGFFFGVKLPVLFPIILLSEVFYLLIFAKKYKHLVIYILGIIAAILVPYFRFFSLGNSIVDYVKIEKFIVNFYLISGLEPKIESFWRVIMTGDLPNIITGELSKVREWTLFWPIIFILFIFYFIKIIREKNIFLNILAIYTLSAVIIFTFIPFYPRYLVLIIPFLYLTSYLYLKKYVKSLLIFIPIILICFINFKSYLNSDPNIILDAFYSNVLNQNFNDIYIEQMDVNKPVASAKQFHLTAKKALIAGNIENIKLETKNVKKLSKDKLEVEVRSTYSTRYLGQFTEYKSINLTKQNFRWRINWIWDIILNNYKPGYEIESNRIVGKRGTIYDSEGKIMVRDERGYLFSVDPNIYDSKKENEMLKLISELNGQLPVRLQAAYLNDNSVGKIDIATNFKILSPEQKKKLESYKGLVIKESPVRIYYALDLNSTENVGYSECCTRIYSATNYHGVSGYEKIYDSKLRAKDGGNILLKDENGNIVREILNIPKKDGQDVTLKSKNY